MSIATHWELENMESIPDYSGDITQDEVLQLQEEYDNILSSIMRTTKDIN